MLDFLIYRASDTNALSSLMIAARTADDKRCFLSLRLTKTNPMLIRRLPALNALRAFEAAARHLSFSAAATELHVTPAAISHQIKALEDDLGVKLFRRLNREVQLTDAGQACLPGLRDG